MEKKDVESLLHRMLARLARWFGPIEQGKNRVGRMS